MAKKKVKVEVDENGIVHFMGKDADGVTERDWLIFLTSSVFFGGIAIGLFFVVLGMFLDFSLPSQYVDLILVMDAPLITILGGLFAVKGVQTWTDGKNNNNQPQSNNQNEGDDI